MQALSKRKLDFGKEAQEDDPLIHALREVL